MLLISSYGRSTMSEIIRPCNGLKRCFRHPTGCAKIVFTAREEYAIRQKFKKKRGRLWHIVREHYRLGAKWGLDPIPPRYHLDAVLFMEQILGQEELFRRIDTRHLQRSQEKQITKNHQTRMLRYALGKDF